MNEKYKPRAQAQRAAKTISAAFIVSLGEVAMDH